MSMNYYDRATAVLVWGITLFILGCGALALYGIAVAAGVF